MRSFTRSSRRRNFTHLVSHARTSSRRQYPADRGAFVESLERRTLLTTTIASGQTIAATLAHPGQIDSYTFSASAGDSFVVSEGRTGFSTLQPYLQVFAPDGTRVFNDYTSGG